MRYDAVLFDFDGTIACTAPDVWGSVTYAAAQLGGEIPLNVRENPANLMLPMETIFAEIQPKISMQKYDEFCALVTHHYRQISQHPKTSLYPGIMPLLEQLQQEKIPCYIVTMKEKEALERVLALKGWRSYFAKCYSPDSFAGQTKQKAELIAYLLQQLPADTKAVYIGDSYTDVQAARCCGIPCIGVCYGDGDVAKLLDEQPDYIAQTADQIIRFLE